MQDTAQKPAPERAYEAVIAKIRVMIEEKNLGPGDTLPPERQLAEIFNVSRHSLREAIRVLQEKGVLSARQGSGNYIQSATRGDLMRTLAVTTNTGSRRALEIFQLREIMEPQLAALAAEMGEPRHIEMLEAILDKQGQTSDGIELRKLDHEFHETLAAATGNATLYELAQNINRSLLPPKTKIYDNRERQVISLEGHKRIVDAIKNKDVEGAKAEMRAHIARVKSTVF
ncbi:putative L-lactate dehydrogenase operon regulatory protein [Maritalea myrionectae]|uniref:Putative L-lactate dehydrogenase operon regulatory protein n=2 Tax=Maritalea myrionectae TaxID=454601 RepID=A0A2R4MD11_9HYPH|nr:putative L-lactate dehydrogenase operon regulatory protein [Maritalea myrionectae]